MNKIISSLLVASTLIFASDIVEDPAVDCMVLKEENSIICKYVQKSKEEDRFIRFEWIDPLGVSSRDRKIMMPKGHGSVYDFRYTHGRITGVWTFKATDGEITYTTTFELK